MYQQFKEVLYHGTVSEITRVDVTAGRDKKDFGRGFYLAVSKHQAVGMMHKKQREAVRRSRNKNSINVKEYLYQITLNTEYVKMLDVKVFEQVDGEWLDFILMCREKGGIPHKHDVVIGPTADDDVVLYLLRAYWDGVYGKTGTLEAKRVLLNILRDNLETENLGIQYFIGSQEAVDHLITSIVPINENERMTESRIELAKGMCVIDVTKFLMNRNNWTDDIAYAHFMGMELYELLMDTASGMYLEPNEYLFECCEIEESGGIDALYDFIETA